MTLSILAAAVPWTRRLSCQSAVEVALAATVFLFALGSSSARVLARIGGPGRWVALLLLCALALVCAAVERAQAGVGAARLDPGRGVRCGRARLGRLVGGAAADDRASLHARASVRDGGRARGRRSRPARGCGAGPARRPRGDRRGCVRLAGRARRLAPRRGAPGHRRRRLAVPGPRREPEHRLDALRGRAAARRVARLDETAAGGVPPARRSCSSSRGRSRSRAREVRSSPASEARFSPRVVLGPTVGAKLGGGCGAGRARRRSASRPRGSSTPRAPLPSPTAAQR